jgi:hypothetical protein
MYRMLQQEEAEDFIATGQTRKLQDFIEILVGRGNASKAAQQLRWQPKFKMAEVVRMMVEAAIEADDGVPPYLPGKQSLRMCLALAIIDALPFLSLQQGRLARRTRRSRRIFW